MEKEKRAKRETEAIKLLLPKGTYKQLQKIAKAEGTLASIKVRQAILAMVRKGAGK
jgi:hypothetical protein